MQQSLFGWREEPDYRMRVQIADQEHALKKQHAGSPDRCRPTEPGQNDFPDDGLHLEQKKGAKKYRCAVEEINHDSPQKLRSHALFFCIAQARDAIYCSRRAAETHKTTGTRFSQDYQSLLGRAAHRLPLTRYRPKPFRRSPMPFLICS